MTKLEEAYERLKTMPPQTHTEVMRGVTLRRRRNGQSVLRLHYSSIPERDPETEEGLKLVQPRAQGPLVNVKLEQRTGDRSVLIWWRTGVRTHLRRALLVRRYHRSRLVFVA